MAHPAIDNNKILKYGIDATSSIIPKVFYSADDATGGGKAQSTPSPASGSGQYSFNIDEKKLRMCIYLIDLKNYVNENILNKAKTKIESDIKKLLSDLVNLEKQEFTKAMLSKIKVSVNIIKTNRLFNKNPYDYPIYLLDYKSNYRSSPSDIKGILNSYGLKNDETYKYSKEAYEKAELWNGKSYYGFTAPRHDRGFVKVAFVKADVINEIHGDLDLILSNVIKHELGHMLGYLTHDSGKTLMSEGYDHAGNNVEYTENNKRAFLIDLSELLYFLQI